MHGFAIFCSGYASCCSLADWNRAENRSALAWLAAVVAFAMIGYVT